MSYEASLTSATVMDTSIDAFTADPTDETLEAAKQAWLAARDHYGLTEAFRFYVTFYGRTLSVAAMRNAEDVEVRGGAEAFRTAAIEDRRRLLEFLEAS